MVEVHHHVEGVVLRVRPEGLHVAPGEGDDVRPQFQQALAQYGAAPAGLDQRQVENLLVQLRPLLVQEVGQIHHPAGPYLPDR